MTATGIPPDVEQFIQTNIDSVELLEVLLHLEKNNLRDMTATAIASALYSNPNSISLRLKNLKYAGLVEVVEDQEPLYHYRPDTSEKDVLIKKLAKVYQERRVAVISAILARQAGSIHAFSDAFLFGKRKDS